jgi:3-oxoacyl-[acyl-carrier protein] reductase
VEVVQEDGRWNEVRLPLVAGSAIVTGGASGIGRSVVAALVSQGCSVACIDRVPATGASGEAGPPEAGGEGSGAPPASTAVRPGSVLVGCAGIRRDHASWNLSEADWRTVLDVDLTGCFTYARAVAPGMRQRGSGRIVFISSINGLRGRFGQANYAAAKAGLVGLGKTLARELGPRGITVNVVAPGMVRTPILSGLTPEQIEASRRETVLGRLGEPEDVAATILFLCSSLARHVTGQVVCVDGGQAL